MDPYQLPIFPSSPFRARQQLTQLRPCTRDRVYLGEEVIGPHLTPGYRHCYFMELTGPTALTAAYTCNAEDVE
jgi:hypothetical protein